MLGRGQDQGGTGGKLTLPLLVPDGGPVGLSRRPAISRIVSGRAPFIIWWILYCQLPRSQMAPPQRLGRWMTVKQTIFSVFMPIVFRDAATECIFAPFLPAFRHKLRTVPP